MGGGRGTRARRRAGITKERPSARRAGRARGGDGAEAVRGAGEPHRPADRPAGSPARSRGSGPRSRAGRRPRSRPRRCARSRPPRRSPRGRAATRSHSLCARPGSGGMSASRGQRPSASESGIPERIPNASAAPQTSPTACSPPGCGASATGSVSISLRSPDGGEQREARNEDGSDGHQGGRTHVRHQGGLFKGDRCGCSLLRARRSVPAPGRVRWRRTPAPTAPGAGEDATAEAEPRTSR